MEVLKVNWLTTPLANAVKDFINGITLIVFKTIFAHSIVLSLCIAYNVLRLCEGGEIEEQMFIRIPMFKLALKPHFCKTRPMFVKSLN
jgi:hypothetical protein